MCARFIVSGERVAYDLFGLDEAIICEPSVAPTDIASIALPSDKGFVLEGVSWGLRPYWSKKPLINARAESVLEQSAFKSAFAEKRCLVPATGFFEWQTASDGTKNPFCFSMADDSPFAFAGFWAEDQEGQKQFCILTTRPNELVSTIHDRMPSIVAKADFDPYLRGDARHAQQIACASYDPSLMRSAACVVPKLQRRSNR